MVKRFSAAHFGRRISVLPVRVVVCFLACGVIKTWADDQRPPQDSTSAAAAPNQTQSPASKPAEPTEPLPAVVIEVNGSVEWAKPGVSPLAAQGWVPVKWKEQLDPGTQIRTGLRSFVHLQFGKTTFVALRSATHASLDQLYRSATAEHVRIGLGHGTVRGGSVEGTIRSDVIVDSPVATLAKRGTEGWEMQVEAGTGRFRISLAEYGLVEAIQKLRGAQRSSRSVRPGEYATDSNIANMWIKQDIFDRNVNFVDLNAVTATDADFTVENTSGYGVLAPGGGTTLVDASERASSDFVLQQTAQNFPGATLPPITVIIPELPVPRPEGHFGTGPTFRVLVPSSDARLASKRSGSPRSRVGR